MLAGGAILFGCLQALLQAADGILSFTRHHEGRTILCVFNLSNAPHDIDMPDGDWTRLAAPFDGTLQTLGPWQALYAAQESSDG